ncbi:indolepyruvate oxidoreductase subunit beta [bacterium]|nr:indolepyruvate oxidoreductase subunit beta [bacterium]
MSVTTETGAPTTTILLVGVGGQGTILAGDILAKTAAAAGMDVKISEIHGMAQRGGSVSTVVRVGAQVHSMICDPGCADVVVAFEAVEALRAQEYLAADGAMIVNEELISPVMVNIGRAAMPDDVYERLADLHATVVPASRLATEVGSPKSANVVLMGALSTKLPFDEGTWREVIARRVPPKTVEANLKAFEAGRRAATES